MRAVGRGGAERSIEERRRELVGVTARLVEFLRDLARTGKAVVRDVSSYETHRWLAELPADVRLAVDLEAGPGELLFGIDPVVSEPAPPPPKEIEDWVGEYEDSSLDRPELDAEMPIDLRTDAVRDAYDHWVATWDVWAEADRALAPRRAWHELLARLARYLEQHDDEYEVVLGTGALSWAKPGHPKVQHPLLTTPLVLTNDVATGRIEVRVADNAVTRICDRALLEEHDGFDAGRAEQIRDDLRQQPAAPLSDATKELLTRWRTAALERARPYEHIWDPPDPPDSAADLRLAPVLILRTRDRTSLIDYFDRMLGALSGPDALAPLGLAQLLVALEAEDRLVWLEQEGATSGDVLGTDPLFPLPSNPEQRQIIERLRHDNGVVVQGPPGTGKSHTIANLIAALLARGQRVLVTSQKAQALRVLRDKLPPELQQLCVSMTDLKRGGSTELNESVNALSDRYATFSPVTYEARIKSLLATRDEAQKKVVELKERIRVLRESETVVHPAVAAGYEGTKARIAEVLNRNAPACGWMPLPLPEHAPFDAPLSLEEAVELRRLLATETPDRAARRGQDLPSLDSLPTPGAVAAAVAAEVAATEAARHASTPISKALEPLSADDVASLHVQSEKAAAALHQLRLGDAEEWPDTWVSRALRDGFARREIAVLSQLAQHTAEAKQAEAQLRAIGLRTVTFPEFDPEGPSSRPGQLAAGRALLGHLAAGNKIKRHFASAVQKQAEVLLAGTFVDGVPITNSELLGIALGALEAEQVAWALAERWRELGVESPGDLPLARRVAQLVDLATSLEHILATLAARDEAEAQLARAGIRVPLGTPEEWFAFAQALGAVEARFEAERATAQLADQATNLALKAQHPQAPPELATLARAIERRDPAEYEQVLTRLAGAFAEQEEQRRCDELHDRLRCAHPLLAEQLRCSASDHAWDERLAYFIDAWAWGRARSYFDRLREPGLEGRLAAGLLEAVGRVGRATAELAAEEAWRNCLLRMTADQEQALRVYRANIDEFGAGTGKWAARFAAGARQAMVAARAAVPAWIMPLREVIETIPPDANSFDVVIIDEASQASIEALFLLWLAPRVIVVGDERQCAPSQIIRGELQPIFDRLDDYLSEVPEYLRLGFTPKSNLFSLLATRFGSVIRLREHFRCMPEIIGWSSRQFYADAPLVPLRQFGADRLPPLRRVHVEGAYTEGSATRLRNPAEAEAIARTIRECIANPAYEDKTFGVVVLQGSGQVRLIEDLLIDVLPADEWERRRLRVGTPPDFQGDERDVVFLSMVLAERRSAFTRRDWQRRFNVAASRAKDQMWLFHSVTPDLLSPADLRRSLLMYMTNPPAPMAVGRFDDLRWDSELRAPFDSKFEQRVFVMLRDRGYTVTPQMEVNGRFIDLVVTGAKGRLAIECDGDYWHSLPEDQQADLDRELDLRRAGWEFWRVRESEFYLDPEEALASLWDALEQRGIRPGDLSTLEEGAGTGEPMEAWEAAPLGEMEGLDGLDGADPAELDLPGGDERRRTAIRRTRPVTNARPAARAVVGDSSPTTGEVRDWARRNGLSVGERGRLHPDVIAAWNRQHPDRRYA